MNRITEWHDEPRVSFDPKKEKALSFPDVRETLCFQLNRMEGLNHTTIARRLNIAQATVTRAIQRAERKIETLKRSGRFDAKSIDVILEKLTRQSRTKLKEQHDPEP